MGLLTQGQPLEWDELKNYSKIVQETGIKQFIYLYNGSKSRADGQFKWGDEIEYILIKYHHDKKIAQMNLSAERVFHRLDEQEKTSKRFIDSAWHPEYASYMVEGTPKLPYDCDADLISGLCLAELNMRLRRRQALSVLEPDESVLSVSNFPRHGCAESSWPVYQPNPGTSKLKSIFVPDQIVFSGHPRFRMVANNIMSRKGSKPTANVPIYFDKNTPRPFIEKFNDTESRKAAKPNHVYLDAVAFGMGCCCLQITLQATHLKEAKTLYDQMVPLAPILTALSASSPAFRGFLTERDCRWNVIADTCDDRTPEEKGGFFKDADGNKVRISKSRYGSVSTYLSCPGQVYNDIPVVYNRKYYESMIANNVELPIAKHIAHLFIRDPIVLYKEKIEQTIDKTDHFENIQTTNWQTLRFKPPPSVDSPIGWRVEFRPIEVQVTDFENAAYSVFVILLSRVILAYKLNFLMPISLVDENLEEAQKRDAVLDSKFWFRKTITSKSQSKPLCNRVTNSGINNREVNCYCQKLLNNNAGNNANRANMATNAGNLNNNASSGNFGNMNNSIGNNNMNVMNNQRNSINVASPTRHNFGSNSPVSRSISPQSTGVGPISNRLINNASNNGNSNNTNIDNDSNSNNGNNNNDNLMVWGPSKAPKIEEYACQMGINEIINGSDRFVGLMPIVQHYVDSMNDGSNAQQIAQVEEYLKFLSDRASGKIKTTAKFMRDFVRSHPDYAHDSVVSEPINHDLVVFLDRVSKGEVRCPELLGDKQIQL